MLVLLPQNARHLFQDGGTVGLGYNDVPVYRAFNDVIKGSL